MPGPGRRRRGRRVLASLLGKGEAMPVTSGSAGCWTATRVTGRSGRAALGLSGSTRPLASPRSAQELGPAGSKSQRVWGLGASTSRRSAASTTSRWRRTSPTGPMVRPTRCGVTSTRGTRSRPATWAKARTKIDTVAIPAPSRALATSPTDSWHTGQVATSRQASTSSARRRSAHSGAVCSRSRTWEVAPVKA